MDPYEDVPVGDESLTSAGARRRLEEAVRRARQEPPPAGRTPLGLALGSFAFYWALPLLLGRGRRSRGTKPRRGP
ncbi:hypothetical protein HRbin29_02285 [bacterium HR29]|jgi:hypothetical protein|nr:hypothetical protein HRbin29_02285 [bacterium HR29]